MSRLEDALRSALGDPVDARPREMVQEVRRGVQRRRARRTTAVAVATASALVVGIAVGGSLLGGGPSPDPAPAPPPPAGDPSTLPHGNVLAVEAGGAGLLATVAGEDACDCTELWRFEESVGWEQVHEFAQPLVRLTMAPDGELGFAVAGGRIWLTRDAGESWAAAGTGGAVEGLVDPVLAQGGSRWPVWAFDAATGTLLRFDEDGFEPVPFNGLGGAVQAVPVGDAVAVQGATGGFVSRDGGATWTELPLPCPRAALRLVPAETTVFAVCQTSDEAVVHRSTDLESWHRIGTFEGFVTDRVALGDDALLLRGARELLVGVTGTEPVTTGRGYGVKAPDAAVLGDTTYLATSKGLLISTDGGLSWESATDR